MSRYGEYIFEKNGDGIVEHPNGFATYRFLNNKTQVYIIDIFVSPELRKIGLASDMANEVVEIAKKEGATELIGTVNPSANGSTESLKFLLAYGMRLKSASDNLIIFGKGI